MHCITQYLTTDCASGELYIGWSRTVQVDDYRDCKIHLESYTSVAQDDTLWVVSSRKPIFRDAHPVAYCSRLGCGGRESGCGGRRHARLRNGHPGRYCLSIKAECEKLFL